MTSPTKAARVSRAIIRQSRRDGEGIVVPVQKRIVPQTNGEAQIELGIELGNAPVPQRRYHAMLVEVEANGDTVNLYFGQPKKRGRGLRSLIEVSMTPDSVRQFLRTCATFHPLLKAFLARNQMSPTPLVTIEDEPEHTVAMVVNMIAAAQSGREVVMDMYHMSAFALRDVREANEVAIEPVVRVDVSAGLMVALLDRLAEIEPSFPGDVR